MPRGIRRVVTGHNAAGCSIFIKDAAAPHVYNRGPGSAVVTELWETRAMPADNRGDGEVTDHPFRLAPPKHGTVFRIIEYPPDKQRLAALEQQRASADDGSGHGAALASEASGQRGNSIVRAPDTRPEPGSSARAAFDRGSPRHPGFHKTSSVDYAIVLSGEIYALMDEGEVLLKAGDVLVQRGTNHAWSNRTDAPACLAFVLVDAEPV
ncbi:MAG TPA: cupin domain-containing protein [Xanthobacteraceae bacterium]|nr:cupin domain-containing protein [Xanthobacteraceae bacterium]